MAKYESLYDIPKLGFGLMRLPKTADGKIDIERSAHMVDEVLANGFYYFDTAYVYDGGDSERAVKEILTKRHPREEWCLATKLPGTRVKVKEDRDRMFNEQLDRTGAGYFDFYLLHGINKNNLVTFEEMDCFNWALDKKAQGLIRHVGFSFHDTPELLDEILTRHPEMEFVQLQINYKDWEADNVQSRGVYEVARKHNKPIVVMEPVKGGSLAVLKDEIGAEMKKVRPEASYASWALRYVNSLDGLLTILSGMSDENQSADNIATMKNFEPLTEEDRKVIDNVVDAMNRIPTVACTGCKYCVEGCPQKIMIPEIISHLNACRVYGYTPSVGRRYNMMLDTGAGKASDCVECGQCEDICPQHLKVIDIMKEAVDMIEKNM